MIEQIKKEPCKKVTTYASGTQNPNGYLIELYKDGDKTSVYLTVATPGSFKGYHLHKVRQSHYFCIKGKVKVSIVEGKQKVEHILSADNPERLLLPTNVYIGLENVGDEDAWLINFPHPAYDPSLKDEQLDKTPEEIEKLISEA